MRFSWFNQWNNLNCCDLKREKWWREVGGNKCFPTCLEYHLICSLQADQAEQLQPAATSWVWWLRSPVVTVSTDTLIWDLNNFPEDMFETLIFKLQSDSWMFLFLIHHWCCLRYRWHFTEAATASEMVLYVPGVQTCFSDVFNGNISASFKC